jgi:PEGA domain
MFAFVVPRFVLAGGLAGALAGALLTLSASAVAEDADGLIKQGVELRRAGNDEAALEQFRRAYDLTPTPRALAQMGLAEQALGRWADAEAHVTRALGSTHDPWIAKYEATLERSRAAIAQHLGSLVVVGGPAGADVRVDGRSVGALPLAAPLRLEIGHVVVDVSASGHVPVTRDVSIVAGQITREDVALSPTSGEEAGASPELPRAATPRLDVSGEGPPPPTGGRRKIARVAAWAAVGLAAVSAGAFVFGQIEVKSYNDHSCGTDPRQAGNVGCLSRYHGYHVGNDIGWGSLVGAGLVGGVAAVLFLTTPASRADGEERVACVPDLARPGATCALRF